MPGRLLSPAPGRADQALLRLEQGKTRLLTEALALGQADLAGLPQKRREALVQPGKQCTSWKGRCACLPDRQDAAPTRNWSPAPTGAAGLGDLIENIRAEAPDFMPTGLDLPGLLKLIPDGGALVAPLATSQGGAVFSCPTA